MPEGPTPAPAAPAPELRRALAEWEGLADADVERLPSGLVNTSYALRTPDGEFVVQRVNPIFSPRIHENIAAVTRRLVERGETTVELVPTRDGRLYVDLGEAGCVRVLRRLSGVCFDVCGSREQARSAGALIARFHAALFDFDGEIQPLGFPYHDTPSHLGALRRALDEHAAHPLHADVARLAQQIFRAAEAWGDTSSLPARVIHGDLKFSNVLFTQDGRRARALIDLDTLSRLPLYYDLGDAWRSWCNASGEDATEAVLDLEVFRASAEGYLSALPEPLGGAELASFGEGLERLSLEVCARFAEDALRESYFDWDRERFASAAEHNWVRARGQWSLHEQARETRAERMRILGAG